MKRPGQPPAALEDRDAALVRFEAFETALEVCVDEDQARPGERAARLVSESGPSDALVDVASACSARTLTVPVRLVTTRTPRPTRARRWHLRCSSNRAGGAGSWDMYLVSFDPQTGAVGPVTPVAGLNTPDFWHAAQWRP